MSFKQKSPLKKYRTFGKSQNEKRVGGRKNTSYLFYLLLGLILFAACAAPSQTPTSQLKGIQSVKNLNKQAAYVWAQGNRIYSPNGTPLLLRGVMPPDPAALEERGLFKREYYAAIIARGANVIRVAVHPERWLHNPDYLRRYLGPLVTWGQELGIYIIIDWHYIGNVISGAGAQMPRISRQPLELTLEFWGQVAEYFRETPHVMFEIFNEPESISAGEWHAAAQRIIGVIRTQGAKQLVIVGGVEFGKDLGWVLTNPLKDTNLAYASHIYPAHSAEQWPVWFGEVSETYPVLMTEWGFMDTAAQTNQKLFGRYCRGVWQTPDGLSQRAWHWLGGVLVRR